MNKSLELLGRGLLVLALGGYAIGCGDDDDSSADSGIDGGGGAGKGGGTGGSKADAGGNGTGGSTKDGGMSAMDECVMHVDTTTGGKTPAACAACVCEHGAKEAVACDATCWSLLDCFGMNCSDVDPSDMAASNACGADKCATFVTGTGTATPLGKVITASCSDVCTATSAGDAGTDDGGT